MAKCLTPYYSSEQRMHFPCGKCFDCKRNRASGWSFRLMQEFKRSISAKFVTLTYNTDHVPLKPNGMSLDKEQFQLFMKRLRRAHERRYKRYRARMRKLNVKVIEQFHSIKYYAVGEYGGKTRRPHYHLILFNADIQDVEKCWTHPETKKPYGEIHAGECNDLTVGYTLKYIQKAKTIPQYSGDQREPEFSLMSKKLGDNYLTDNMKRWHKRALETRYYAPLYEGVKAPLPRYYKEKIYTALERQVIGKKLQDLDKTITPYNFELNKIKRNEQRLKRETFKSKNL